MEMLVKRYHGPRSCTDAVRTSNDHGFVVLLAGTADCVTPVDIHALASMQLQYLLCTYKFKRCSKKNVANNEDRSS